MFRTLLQPFMCVSSPRRCTRRFRATSSAPPVAETLEQRVVLSGDNIIIQDDFETGSPNANWDLVVSQDGSDGVVSGISRSGDHSYHINYSYDEDQGMLQEHGIAPTDEVYVRYWQMYPEEFSQRDLKQAYLFNNDESVGLQGNLILSLFGPSFLETEMPEMLTVFYGGVPNSDGTGGEEGDIRGSYNPFNIPAGEWFRTAFYAKWNTPGKSDGIYKLWQNDQLIVELHDVKFRATEKTPDSLWIGGNYSGGGTDPIPFDRYIDDIFVATNPADDPENNQMPAPVVTGPVTPYGEQRPTTSWTSVPNATLYEVEIDNLTTGTTAVLTSRTKATQFRPTNPLGIGRFQIRIRAMMADGASTAWSTPVPFVINTPVQMKMESVQYSVSRPEVQWEATPGAARYDVWINSLSTGRPEVLRNQNVTSTRLTPPTDLPLGTYRIWVRAIDAAGTAAQWSKPADMTISTPPVSLGPVGSTFFQRPTFAWKPVTGASSYNVFIQNRSTGAWEYRQTGVTSTSWIPPRLLQTGLYRWYVQAVGTDQVKGLFSPAADIFIGGRPEVTAPSGTATNSRPTFSWKSVEGAANYELWVNRVDIAQAAVIHQTRLTGTSFTSSIALAKGTYRIWVRAISTLGQTSPWTNPIDFKIV